MRSEDTIAWNAEKIGRLRSLWAEGHSTAEIGRRMGISKNAVVGKSHRLRLPPRPSPIRIGGAPVCRPPYTLPPPRPKPVTPVTIPPPPPVPPAPVRPVAPLRVRPDAIPLSVLGGRIDTACVWPIGEPGTAAFHFCDASSAPGKPYCAAHVQLAYRRPRNDRIDYPAEAS